MDEIVLKPEIMDKIKSDADLFAGVAKALKISPSTLPNVLSRNDPRLTQANVLKVISEHLDIQDTQRLLEMQEA